MQLQLDPPGTVPAWPSQGARRQNLFLICREALHNAALHGQPERLMLTSHGDDELIFEALKAGAVGYLLRRIAHG